MDSQAGWRWCIRCQSLAWSGIGNGICHDGQPHDLSRSGQYSLRHDVTPEGTQGGWRWCTRCQGLIRAGAGNGYCYGGGRHNLRDSGQYSVPHETTPEGAQPSWRWCRRCKALAWLGFGNGMCVQGKPHDFSRSGEYSVPHERTHLELKLDVLEQDRTVTVRGEGFSPQKPVHLAYIRGDKNWSPGR